MDQLGHGRAENDPLEPAEVDEGTQQHRELVAGVTAVGADPELLREALVLEQAETVWVFPTSTARSKLGIVVGAKRLTDPFGERFGGQPRLLALAAQLLDRDVARGEHLRAAG